MRKPLGRGLDALIGAGDAFVPRVGAAADAQLMTLPVDSIHASPFQPRIHFDELRLDELTRAIKSQGIIEPLVVRKRRSDDLPMGVLYELIAGERRLRAARAAGLQEVPVVVRELDDRGALEMSLVENLLREELNAVEEGRALRRLNHDFGLTQEEVATRIGKSRAFVTNAIRLVELPEQVLELIVRGAMSAGQARPLLALSSAQAQIAAARRIVDSGISARGAEEIAINEGEPRARRAALSEAARVDPNLQALGESLQRALKRKVRIMRRRGRNPGRIEIDYYDINDLNALAAALIANARASAHA
jgi:ParB family transcriptional regulator, chromosome partitioning protein